MSLFDEYETDLAQLLDSSDGPADERAAQAEELLQAMDIEARSLGAEQRKALKGGRSRITVDGSALEAADAREAAVPRAPHDALRPSRADRVPRGRLATDLRALFSQNEDLDGRKCGRRGLAVFA